MFNPDEVRRLKTKAIESPNFEVFEGRHVRQIDICVNNNLEFRKDSMVVAGNLYPAARIFGIPFDAQCLNGIGAWPVRSPKMAVSIAAGASIIGTTSIVDATGVLYSPERICTIEDLNSVITKTEGGFQGFTMVRRDAETATCYFSGRSRPRNFGKTALFFHNPEPGNYGSFIFRQLPQMLRARTVVDKIDCYVVTERTQWLFEALKILKYPDKEVFTTREVSGEVFKAVIFTNEFDSEGFLQPETIADLYQVMNEAGVVHGRATKVYVSRSLSSMYRPWYRHCLNELEIEDAARARGFQVVYPETLSLRSQMATFCSATQIVGLSGSGMFNSIFARGTCRVLDIESFHNTVRQHAKFYSSTNREYSFLFGKLTENDDRHPLTRSFEVSLSDFDEALDWLASNR